MAPSGSSNGTLVKALGVAGLVIGIVGGSIGLASKLGPEVQIERNTETLRIVDNRSRENERSVAVIQSQLSMILETVREIRAAVK